MQQVLKPLQGFCFPSAAKSGQNWAIGKIIGSKVESLNDMWVKCSHKWSKTTTWLNLSGSFNFILDCFSHTALFTSDMWSNPGCLVILNGTLSLAKKHGCRPWPSPLSGFVWRVRQDGMVVHQLPHSHCRKNSDIPRSWPDPERSMIKLTVNGQNPAPVGNYWQLWNTITMGL